MPLTHKRMLKSNFFKCILKEWRWLKTSVRSLRKYTKCYRTLGKEHNSHTLQSLNLGEKLHWNASQKNLNNRAWIIERESPESGILNVECKYWTLLLWKSFVEALNESNFCCFVLFQTIIIIVNRAGNRAMLANFTSTVVILLSCFLRQSIVGLKLFGTFVKSCAIINSGVFTLVRSLNKADPTLISYLRNDRAVCAPFQF